MGAKLHLFIQLFVMSTVFFNVGLMNEPVEYSSRAFLKSSASFGQKPFSFFKKLVSVS